MSFNRQYFAWALLSLLIVVLSACGGSDNAVTTTPTEVQANSVTVNASVTGLGAGKSFVLQDTLGNTLTVSSNGTSSFANPIAVGAGYSVSVRTQPVGQTCSLAASTGAGVAGSSVNVQITCSVNSYRVSGLVSGLGGGNTVSLSLNGGTPTVASNGPFDLGALVAFGGSYAVTVATQPTGQTCAVSNASGAGMVGDVSNVAVLCSANTYALGGSLSGLAASTQVSLLNNGADALTLNANGSFNFATPVPFGGSYAVTVGTQPNGQSCSASNASGTMGAAPVSNVAVLCSANTYSISGSLSGLAAGEQVTLRNNGADPITLSANGGFNFPVQVPFNGVYAVTVATQPANGQVCSVTNASGTMGSTDVSNVQVACVSAFTVGGSITGLFDATGLVLLNTRTGGTESIAIPANSTTFAFSTRLPQGQPYALTVFTQPNAITGQTNPNRSTTCTASGGANGDGTGTMGAANVTNLQINCSNQLSFLVGRAAIWAVPAGVTLLQRVEVAGGGGGSSDFATAAVNRGGDGARIRLDNVSVTPGEQFFIGVGAGGGAGARAAAGNRIADGGGGGGGASWWVPNNSNPFADARSIIMAGGGGSGVRGSGDGGRAGDITGLPPGDAFVRGINAGGSFSNGSGGGQGGSGRAGIAATPGGCGVGSAAGDALVSIDTTPPSQSSGPPAGAGGFGGTVRNAANFLVASAGSAATGPGGGGGGSGAADRCGQGGARNSAAGETDAGGGGAGASYVSQSNLLFVSQAFNGGRSANPQTSPPTPPKPAGDGRLVMLY